MSKCWVLLLLCLLSGWLFSLRRERLGARIFIALSAPVGAVVGWFSGFYLCRWCFRLQGIPPSQHEWIAWSVAAALGMAIGYFVFTVAALILTEPRPTQEQSEAGQTADAPVPES